MQVKLISITKPEIKIEKDGQQIELNPEELIVYCARVSSPKNQDNIETSEKLLNFLIKHAHWSPLEMVDMTIEVITSRAIAQQMIRHKSFSIQEYSQRYSEVNSFEPVQLRKQAETNRQSSLEIFNPSISFLTVDNGEIVRVEGDADSIVRELIGRCNDTYKALVGAEVAKECARMVLPLTTSTRLYFKGNIRSWVHWFDVRLPENTQLEHREIAQKCLAIFKENFPTLYRARYEKTEYDPDFKSKAPEFIRQLREKTGAGLFDCKEAVKLYGLDENKCIEYIRTKGLA